MLRATAAAAAVAASEAAVPGATAETIEAAAAAAAAAVEAGKAHSAASAASKDAAKSAPTGPAAAPSRTTSSILGELAPPVPADACRFIVNVSAMEGRFFRSKMPTHPHTNMAKVSTTGGGGEGEGEGGELLTRLCVSAQAALNMMVRTSAGDYAQDWIYMTAGAAKGRARVSPAATTIPARPAPCRSRHGVADARAAGPPRSPRRRGAQLPNPCVSPLAGVLRAISTRLSYAALPLRVLQPSTKWMQRRASWTPSSPP